MHAQTPSRKPNGRLKIKVEQATCDQCRSGGLTCKAPDSVDERCGQCDRSGATCTWRIGPRPLGRSPPSPSYVAYLESQVGQVEKKLREILPGVNLNRELETLAQLPASPPHHRPTYSHLDANSGQSQSSSGGATPFQHTVDHEPPVLNSAPELLKKVRLATEVAVGSAPSQAQELRTDTYWSDTASTRPEEPRFHGQSSGEMFLKDAKEIKREFVELSLGQDSGRSTQGQSAVPAIPQKSGRLRERRPQFWKPTPPEQRSLTSDLFEFNASRLTELRLPPPDLVHDLVGLFFRYINPFFPILHRETFELELARGTHLLQVLEQRARDKKNGIKPDMTARYGLYARLEEDYPNPGPPIEYTRGAGTFARVLLLVCACASRWSEDPRVMSTSTRANPQGEGGTPNSLSSGYNFFREVGQIRWTMCAQAGLWDVQVFILAAIFLHGSSAHYGAWTVLGIGIRFAQDIGAHRKKEGVSIENELYKRSFWALMILDRLMCGTFGRPSAMQDLDSDLDNVMEVDDEYWPVNGPPAQPPGKPSRLAFFNGMIGLIRVLGRALQTVFAIDRTKRQMDLIGHEKERELLADLRRHLERWTSRVPVHLQLTRPDQFAPSVFLDQMVSLWATYYNINILIHRPFITIKSSPLTTECLNICRISARSCAKIIGGHWGVTKNQSLPSTIQSSFSTAMVLLVDILATSKDKRSDSRAWPASEDWYPTEEKEADVERCRLVLARAEKKWHIAGRLHDTLREFQRTGSLLIGPNSATSASVTTLPTSTSSGRIHPAPGTTQSASATFDLDHTSSEISAESNAGSRRASSVSDSSNIYGSGVPAYSSYGPTQQYDNSGYTDSQPASAYPYNPYYHDQSYTPAQPNRSRRIIQDYALPHDFAGVDSGAYLPDAYYGDNTNVPFPGLVPQLSFAPNQGRGDVYAAAGCQEPLRGEVQNPNWPSEVPRPTPVSQWEQLLRNATWDTAGGSQSPS